MTTVELIIEARNLAEKALQDALEGLQDVNEEAEKSGGAAEKASRGVSGLTDGFKALAATAVVKFLADAAVELGMLGVQAEAVEEKFVAMAGGQQQASQMLVALQAATGNTVDEMALMAETSKMLGMGLASNAEEASELAMMAVRLGDAEDTARDRMAKFNGLLANQSIEVLDTYNISSARVRARIIELQEATAGLSREEAFKIAVMEEGRIALERLGDAGLGAAQSVEQQRSAWQDLRVEIGRAYTGPVEGISQGLGNVTRKMANQLTAAREMRGEYSLLRLNIATVGEVLGFTNTIYDQHYEKQARIAENGRLVDRMLDDVREGLVELQGEPIQAMEELSRVTEASQKAFSNLKTAIGGALGEELDRFAEKQASARDRVAELSDKIADLEGRTYLTGAQQSELEKLRGQLGDAQAAVEENAAAHEEATKRIVFGFMEQRLAMDGLTQAELMALQDVANQWGLIDDATYTAIQGIDNVASAFEDGKISVDGYGEALGRTGDAMRNLPSEHTFTLKLQTDGQLPMLPTGPGGEHQDPVAFASGGTMSQSGWALVGEEGPELLKLPAGAEVYNAQDTAQMMGGARVEAPVIIHATVASDVDIEALAWRVSEVQARRLKSLMN